MLSESVKNLPEFLYKCATHSTHNPNLKRICLPYQVNFINQGNLFKIKGLPTRPIKRFVKLGLRSRLFLFLERTMMQMRLPGKS